MFNLLNVIDLGPDASEDEADRLVALLDREMTALPGIVSAKAGKTLPDALYGGHLISRIAFACEDAWRACEASSQWQSRILPALAASKGIFVDSAAYHSTHSCLSAGPRTDGIWRCLMFAADTHSPAESLRQFERDMLLMPGHVSTIRNWSLGHVVWTSGRRRWTHVWEQEFDNMGGLTGEYMTNPIHWGLIDGWYDPESPTRIIDIVCIVHAALAIDEAIIG